MTKEILRKIEEIEKKAGKSWLTIAQKAKTEGDLIKIASEYGVSLTKDQAAEYSCEGEKLNLQNKKPPYILKTPKK